MPDTSIAILKDILQSGQIDDNKYLTAVVHENLGETYYEMKSFDEATEHFTQAARRFEELGNRGDLAYESLYLGKSFYQLTRLDAAKKHLFVAGTLYRDLSVPHYEQEVYQTLSSVYADAGRWDSAHHYLVLANTLSDTIHQRQQRRFTEELKEKYERRLRDNEIALLKVEQNLMLEKDERQKRLLWFMIIGMVVMAIVVVQWVSQIRLRRRLHLEQLRRQISRDLHDDIGSTLSSIEVFSGIAQQKTDTPSYVHETLGKINAYSKQVMENMSDIVWATNPKYDHFESLVSRLREYAVNACEMRGIALSFKIPDGLEKISFPADQRKHLYLLLKEAINNALKHSECKNLNVHFTLLSSKTIRIEICDDGKGFDPAAVSSGNGLNNLRERAANLNATFEMQSKPGKGTCVKVQLKT
jgi:signal transduction histidine kinase